MSKLKNVKAIQDMLSGTHKTQTRQSHYYGNTKTKVNKDDIIEIDENDKPKVWIETDLVSGTRTRVTQHDGFKSRESEAGYLVRKLQKELSMPNNCPECGQNMSEKESNLNKKFWVTHKQCFDCVVTFETKLRNDKEAWDVYCKQKMLDNAKSFFKDADGDVEGLRKMLTQKLKNVQNADGDIETFEEAMSDKEFNETIMKEYNIYKQNVLNGLKRGEQL
jgi:transcription elongation factor Elf1